MWCLYQQFEDRLRLLSLLRLFMGSGLITLTLLILLYMGVRICVLVLIPLNASHLNIWIFCFKENLDTLGAEIARLSQENRRLQLHLQGLSTRWHKRHFFSADAHGLAGCQTGTTVLQAVFGMASKGLTISDTCRALCIIREICLQICHSK